MNILAEQSLRFLLSIRLIRPKNGKGAVMIMRGEARNAPIRAFSKVADAEVERRYATLDEELSAKRSGRFYWFRDNHYNGSLLVLGGGAMGEGLVRGRPRRGRYELSCVMYGQCCAC